MREGEVQGRAKRVTRILALVMSGCALAVASPASAAVPVDLGPIANDVGPNLVVDAAGTGYLTWARAAGSGDVVDYCRILQGGTACATALEVTFGPTIASDRGNYPLLGPGNRVLIVNGRVGTSTTEGAKYVIDSADGGVTFDGGALTAVDFRNIYGGAAFIDNAVLTVGGYTNTSGPLFQASLADPPPTVSGKFSISNGATTSGSSLAIQGESVVVSYTDSTSAYSRQLVDDDNINSSAAWSAPQLITTVGFGRAELLSGPSGFYYAYVTPDGQDIAIRALTGGTWGPPVVITPPGGGVSGRFAVTEDPSGIVHVAYTESDGDLMYRYARSTANTEFTNPQTLVPYPNDASSFSDLELEVNASGNGYVSYFDSDRGRVMPVAPGEPATPPGAGGGGGGGGGEYSGPTADTTTPAGGGSELALTGPKECVASGASFKVSVSIKAKKGKPKPKIKKAVFSAAGVAVATVKKKPFEATISTAGVIAKTLEVSAKVTIKTKKPGHKAKKKKKTLKQTIQIC